MKLITGITNGKPEALTQFFENCKFFEGKKVDIEIKLHSDKRSIPQNRSYWLLRVQPVTAWLRDLGNDVTEDDVHYFLKAKFLGYKIKTINGKEVKILRSTKELSTIQFAEYMESIAIHFSGLGLILKDPDQKDFLDKEEKNN